MGSRGRFSMAVATAAVTFVTGSSSAWADQPEAGEFPTPQAQENCIATIIRQSERGVFAGGGPKAEIPAPTNCDHFFGAPGKH